MGQMQVKSDGVLQTRKLKSKTTCNDGGTHHCSDSQSVIQIMHVAARVLCKSGGTKCVVAKLFNIFDPDI